MVDDERTSAEVTRRSLELLWRDHLDAPPAGGGRGRPRALTIDRVVEAAVDLADAEGLEAMTMRRLATDLGVRAMTLYTYVPSRAVLLDLMLDAVYARTSRPPLTGPWQERVRTVADGHRAILVAHPWMAAVSTARPPLGPGVFTTYEHELGAFEGSGLDDLTVDDALSCVLSFVRTSVREQVTAEAARGDQDDEAWWASAGPLLAQVVDPAAVPLASRIGSAAGEARGSAHDPEHAYRFGLDALILAFEALAAR